MKNTISKILIIGSLVTLLIATLNSCSSLSPKIATTTHQLDLGPNQSHIDLMESVSEAFGNDTIILSNLYQKKHTQF